MVYKGVVMEVEKSYIIVLTHGVDYVKLKKKGNVDIGKKIMFIEDDIIRESYTSFKPFIGIAAAIILIIATIIGGFGIDFIKGFQAYAIVSLDINPSLEFQIDDREIVKKVNPLNDQGQEIIDDNMVGMKIENAVIYSIKKAIDKEYLNNENNIVLISNVILNDDVEHTAIIENEIYKKVEEDDELQDIDLIYVDSDKEVLEKARENHVSVGKYKVYEIVSTNKPEVKVEDIKNKKVSDLVKEHKELRKDEILKTNKKIKEKKDKIKKEINKKKQIKNKNKEEEKKDIKYEIKKKKRKLENMKKAKDKNESNKGKKQKTNINIRKYKDKNKNQNKADNDKGIIKDSESKILKDINTKIIEIESKKKMNKEKENKNEDDDDNDKGIIKDNESKIFKDISTKIIEIKSKKNMDKEKEDNDDDDNDDDNGEEEDD
ncbi:MAG: anti-sigma factor domain-containing protein [Maledivibacter sp.]|jgi:hypothetical protein|nr:anti-sigma factor domain-containing protein [Maledivibacter sp.]